MKTMGERQEEIAGRLGQARAWVQKHPMLALGLAVGVGYVLGGGLLTPFTRRVLRLSARAFAVPAITERLVQQSQTPER